VRHVLPSSAGKRQLTSVGENVGVAVGSSVGAAVGVAVGSLVGDAVGACPQNRRVISLLPVCRL
jgi:hypothetical protein